MKNSERLELAAKVRAKITSNNPGAHLLKTQAEIEHFLGLDLSSQNIEMRCRCIVAYEMDEFNKLHNLGYGMR